MEDGSAGNPINPNGVKTAYLREEILTPEGLTDIVENYAEKVGGRQIWPRYHQLDVTRKLLADVRAKGPGQRYLVQHSAGSGKSNSIAWTSRQLIDVEHDGHTAFDSTIVIIDRRNLDRQINDTIRLFTQVSSTVAHADRSGDLRRFIEEGKRIIITTVQKFPFILDDIGNEHRDRRFAIIIDEAHSSQGGKASGAVAQALGQASDEDDDDSFEDQVNRIIESRRLLSKRLVPRVHGNSEEQDPGTLRNTGPPSGRNRQAPPLPQLHDEAGDPGRVHHGRASKLHPGQQVFQPDQERGGRPGVRLQAGPEKAAAVRGEPSARHL